MCSTKETAAQSQQTASGVPLTSRRHASGSGYRQQEATSEQVSLQKQLELVHTAAEKLSKVLASEQHGHTAQHAQRIRSAMQQLLHACRSWSTCMLAPAPAPAPANASDLSSRTQVDNPATIDPSMQLSIIQAVQAIVPCLEAPHSSLFAAGEDPDLQLVDATRDSAREQLSMLGSTWLQIVHNGLLSVSLLAPAALQGVRLQQQEQQDAAAHASGISSFDGNEVQQGTAEELLGLLHGSRVPKEQPQTDESAARRTVVIEVLNDSSEDTASAPAKAARDSVPAQAAAQAEVQCQGEALVHRLVQLFATWVPDAQLPYPYAVPGPDNGTGHQPTDTQQTHTSGSRNSNAVTDSSEPALTLLHAVAATVQEANGPSSKAHRQHKQDVWALVAHSAAAGLLGPQVLAQQALLAHVSQTVLPALRRVVAAGTAGWAQAYDGKGPFTAHSGPSLQERVIAARRIAALVRQLQHPALSAAMPVALPAALAAAQDASPAVAVHGMWALHHMAVAGLAADLRVQGDLVVEAARRMLVGCQDATWQPACVASVALTVAVLGSNLRAPGYHALMSEMLTEIERHAHNSARRLAFMTPTVLHLLIQRLGLTTLRHTSRLLPLLLEWLQAYDAASRACAAHSLHVLLTHIWPRAPAHAACIWHHISALLLREAAAAALTAERVGSMAGDGVGRDGSGGGVRCLGTGDRIKPQSKVMPHAWLNSDACGWALHLCDMLAACGGLPFTEAVQVTAYQLDMLSTKQPEQQQQTGVCQAQEHGLQQPVAQQQQQGGEQQQEQQEEEEEVLKQSRSINLSRPLHLAAVTTAAKLVQNNPTLGPVLRALLRHVWALCTQCSHNNAVISGAD